MTHGLRMMGHNPSSDHSLHQTLDYERYNEKCDKDTQRYGRIFQRIDKPHHDGKQAGQYAERNQETLQDAALNNPKSAQVNEEVDQPRSYASERGYRRKVHQIKHKQGRCCRYRKPARTCTNLLAKASW